MDKDALKIIKRYLKFAVVGASGAVIQMAISALLFDWYAPTDNKGAFMLGTAGIFAVTSIWNFTFNSIWTWKGK